MTRLHYQVKETLQDLVLKDIVQYNILPYVSQLDQWFTIQVGPPTLYHCYKGIYFETESPANQMEQQMNWTTFTDCDRISLARFEERDNDYRELRDPLIRKSTWLIGRHVSIVPSKRFTMINEYFDQVVKDQYDIMPWAMWYCHATGYKSVSLGINHYGWFHFLRADNKEEFEALKTAKISIQLKFEQVTYDEIELN